MPSTQSAESQRGYIETQGLSGAHVKQAIDRFMVVNAGRLSRVREGLQSKQHQCFDMLPLLFHLNLEHLPGFIDHPELPYGIARYVPDDAIVRLSNALFRGGQIKQVSLKKPSLSALYLMGSSGSVGQSTNSDMDIWVCYDHGLSPQQIHLLEKKCSLITQWAASFNLEVHFFLMDALKFIGGEQRSLTGENCGTAQHVLLLDEFYRTAQLLAGNVPAWWLVPVEEESRYEQVLTECFEQGYLKPSDCTSFGSITELPAGEFVGAGLWQIYKAIDSPYKSVLKLILLEIYARQYPNINSLAHRYKKNIYRLRLSLDDLDPYIMLYRFIEEYLMEREEFARLELIRRCFYFKVGLNLSKNIRTFNWRRELMDYLVNSWGWQAATIKHLDNYRHWSIDDLLQERKLLINELTQNYRFLTEFASEHHSTHTMSQQDLLILSRKLHTAFDRRPGKIDFVGIGLDVDLSSEKIRLYQRESKQEPGVYLWAAYNKSLDDNPGIVPLKYSKSLLETLLWCHLNGLISAHLHIPIYPLNENINEYELRMTIASMRQHLPTPMTKINSASFYHPAILTKVVMFINLGRDPLHYLSAKGLQKISARSSSFDFSGKRENLVLSLDMVLVNNWGEVVVEHFSDKEATTKALKILVNKINKQSRAGLPEVETVCHSQTRPQAIAAHLKLLFQQALTALCSASSAKTSRFIFNMQDQFVAFQYRNRVTNYQTLNDISELTEYLGEAQEDFSPITFDDLSAKEQPLLASLAQQHQQNTITLAYEVVAKEVVIYIIDEYGTLRQFRQTYHNTATLISPIVRFLKFTEHRQRRDSDTQWLPQRKLQCFEVSRKGKAVMLTRMPVKGLVSKGHFTGLQTSIDLLENGQFSYHVSCNEQEFYSAELGSNFYARIASFILGLRSSGLRYPCYITDVALSESVIENLPFGRDQTSDYLLFKLRIENRINEALATL